MYKNLTYITVLIAGLIWFGTPSQAKAQQNPPSSQNTRNHSAKKSPFSGFYIGLGGSFNNVNLKLSNIKYSRGGGFFSIETGYSHVLPNKLFLGGELKALYDPMKINSTNTTVKNGLGFGLSGKIGIKLDHNIVPFLRLGIETNRYQYIASNKKDNFFTTSISTGIGLEGAFTQNWYGKLAFDYGFALTVSGLDSNVKVEQKPRRASISMSFGYRF